MLPTHKFRFLAVATAGLAVALVGDLGEGRSQSGWAKSVFSLVVVLGLLTFVWGSRRWLVSRARATTDRD